MVIDTVNDVVISDIDDKIVTGVLTGGVAVRPFWWSNECLEALGLKTYTLGQIENADKEKGSEDTATGWIKTDADGGADQAAGSPLSTVMLVLVALLSMLLLAATAYIVKLSVKKRMISKPNATKDFQTPQPTPSTSQFPAFCANCGSPLVPGSNFCPGCGKKILEH